MELKSKKFKTGFKLGLKGSDPLGLFETKLKVGDQPTIFEAGRGQTKKVLT